MMIGKNLRIALLVALTAGLLNGGSARAANVLMVNIDGSYDADGSHINDTLVNAGATTTYIHLTSDGQVATALGQGAFDQIWVFDLSTGADAYPTDYTAIADWFNSRIDAEIICDSRMISSYWSGRWTGEGQNLTENYLQNLDSRGGGLVLGTDHAPYQTGINEINDQIGIEPFVGTFGLTTIPVDTSNPLMTTPNDMGATLYDDSTPGQTPYGLQSNGRILYTVAWHSNNPDTPGISSTIEGGIGFHVDIVSPAAGSVFEQADLITLEAVATGGDAPFTYAWSYGGGTPLGNGATLQITAGDLPIGPVTITVLAEDDFGRDDDDSVTITVNNMLPQCDAGDPQTGSAGVPVQFDGTASLDPDGQIVSWSWDFGDGTTGSGPMPMHTYAEDGSYVVTLCVTDDDGAETCCTPGSPTVPNETMSWGSVKTMYR